MQVSPTRHKELTAHIRACIARNGIKARVQMMTSCGSQVIKVFGTSYEARFTADEIRSLCQTALTNRLTFVRGMEINPEFEAKLTGKTSWEFYI